MFVSAIEQAAKFTRPVQFIHRYFGSTEVAPGAASLFFVNADGWALTCKHVTDELAFSEQTFRAFPAFKQRRDQLKIQKNSKQLIRKLEEETGFKPGSVVEQLYRFVECVEGIDKWEWHPHQDLDLALIHFTGHKRLLCTDFPVFAADDNELKPGKTLCRLGYPFSEFTTFRYDPTLEQISWTDTGSRNVPRFPIDGMVTRMLVNPGGATLGFEMSTPGLRGQSGGPAFDRDGHIWGMQARTKHLDLGFDVALDVYRRGKKEVVRNSPFLHVGECVHVSQIREFMNSKGVAFQTRSS